MGLPKPGSKPPDALCNAMTKSGRTCTQPAGQGTDHYGIGRCMRHGGRSPSYRTHLSIRRLQDEAVAYGTASEINPYEALLDAVRWSHGHVKWLRDRIAESANDVSLLRQHRELLARYRVEREFLAKVSDIAVKANVAERITALAESDGQVLVRITHAAAERAGLTDEQRRALMIEMAAGYRARATINRAQREGRPVIDATTRDDEADDPDSPLPALPANVTVTH